LKAAADTGLDTIEYIPLLLVLAGPFYIRRTRRGLRAQLKGERTATDR
jgi:hypothetical protein